MFIEIGIAATVGAIAGSAIMRRIDLRKIVELRDARDHAIEARVADILPLANLNIAREAAEANASSARLADACLAKQARIDRALECETPKAAHGVRKMARILRGDA